MKTLSLSVAICGVVALLLAITGQDVSMAGFGVAALICSLTTYRSTEISSFLQIFVAIFSAETVVFGVATLAARGGLWPAAYAQYMLPESLALTVAIFSIGVYLVSHAAVVRQITCIADLYFDASEHGQARIPPLRPITALERHIAAAMIVCLVLINQTQVGIMVRLSFFNRDWFDAIQNRDAAGFWQLLLFVFTPWAFIYVTTAVAEFVVQSMLVIRWRRWLTDHFMARWLSDHAHYRMSLIGVEADNPDQRIAEDVSRFIDGGAQGYGIYSYSIMLISNLSSLVSFAVVLWGLSANFSLPGTEMGVPGLLFWVALIYASAGTAITHLIGRSLVGLYFERQQAEASFRFSLARLREHGEQIALLEGERAERLMLLRRFGAIISNYLATVSRRKKLLAFTATYGQLSPIIPYIFTAPFYFAGQIQLGILTQTAGAFASVANALTFFVNYYTSLADFKSVVDRLTSFETAIASANALGAGGPRLLANTGGAATFALEDIGVALPDGRRIVDAERLHLEQGERVLLVGPSGSGKSTLFRAISGIWPFGKGHVRLPERAKIMVVPQKAYLPIGTLRAALAYPEAPDSYPDEIVRRALKDAHLGFLAEQLDHEQIWSQRLSGGEQQRVALARVLLARPDLLFLDESTSATDEQLEAELYAVLAARLPMTTIVSISHRSSLGAFHNRRLDMAAAETGRFMPRDAGLEAVG